jgi:hypothetical protein
MRLERAWVDHRGLRSRAFGGQRGEDPVERADPAPAHETVAEGLVPAAGSGGASAHQPAPHETDDAADHPPVINPKHPARLIGQKRLQVRKLRLCEPQAMIGHGEPPNFREVESQAVLDRKPLYEP